MRIWAWLECLVARVDGVSTNAVPVELIPLDGSGDVVGSLSNLFAAVARSSDGFQYDWDDGTFKASPTTATALMVDSGDQGIYHLAAGWTVPALTVAETYAFTVDQVGAPASVANVPATWTMGAGPLTGTATLADNLVDDLVPLVDELRADLYADFGVRQFSTSVVRKVWSGAEVGSGSVKVTRLQYLTPPPDVVLEDTHSLTPGGLQATGTATLHEVSLSYTQNQLLGEPLAYNEEHQFLVVDALGQGIARRLFIPQDHPMTDRTDGIGWDVKIRLVDTPPNVYAGAA
jgi:hypothetical protein